MTAAATSLAGAQLSRPAPTGEQAPSTPLDHWLAAQGDLRAVARFTQRHESGTVPAHARYYRDLIPLTAPGPGQQYGFEVDLDACTGCKACVTACHQLNGLEDEESWRSVGLLHGGSGGPAVQQHVTTACHHCVEPACLQGCPVEAYVKDPTTGIVRHLDDQCIGCGYCTWTCPYEVPTMSARLGIVRKCDLCTDRLAAGEAPACVQGCPNGAIRVGLVDVAAARVAAATPLVPGAPASTTTVPTTTYRSATGIDPGLVAADASAVVPGHAHPSLAVMLVLTQLSVGAFLVDLTVRLLAAGGAAEALPSNAVGALVAGLMALGASVLHLGRPHLAFRAVLGVRRSWLSREIVAFVAFAGAAAAHAGATVGGVPLASATGAAVAGAVVVMGVTGVACSVMIYAATGRRWWRVGATGPRFALTTVSCGAATVLASSLAAGADGAPALVAPLTTTVVASVIAKLLLDASVVRHRHGSGELRGTAVLLTRDLRSTSVRRLAAGTLGGVVLPVAVLVTARSPVPNDGLVVALAVAALALLVAGELLERNLHFTASTPRRMPGAPT
ncbi:MAG TPA: DmsC/YnfH family molybdoenzyme membrane anchor subunit [Acidimicrobiales bacterium]|nr:DmsC/YnfH family molybdoenzyme membrane anchor subunit [Acidimicrobiales bacterium]